MCPLASRGRPTTISGLVRCGLQGEAPGGHSTRRVRTMRAARRSKAAWQILGVASALVASACGGEGQANDSNDSGDGSGGVVFGAGGTPPSSSGGALAASGGAAPSSGGSSNGSGGSSLQTGSGGIAPDDG